MILSDIFLVLIGMYLSCYVLYHLILFIIFISSKDIPAKPIIPETRFCVLIPAHNEELLISRLLLCFREQAYPKDLFKCFVIADNCTDNTARISSENGAMVLKRLDKALFGKGHALKWALEKIDLTAFDAVLIVDADSVVGNDILLHLDRSIREGNRAIQCYNGVANPHESWFTRLLHVSRTIGNEIVHPAKQRLGLSSYLMGNGMCFSTRLLSKFGWDAFTVGEDWEYYAKIVREGESVAFCKNARVFHQESYSMKQATSQRLRWSSGRFAIAWSEGLRIFRQGIMERNTIKIDAAFPLIFPNPSLGINISVILMMFSIFLPSIVNKYVYTGWFAVLIVLQILMFVYGIMYTEEKLKGFLSMFIAPLFLVWKMGIDVLSLFGIGRERWVPTARGVKSKRN